MWTVSSSSLSQFLASPPSELAPVSSRALPSTVFSSPDTLASSALAGLAAVPSLSNDLAIDATQSTPDTSTLADSIKDDDDRSAIHNEKDQEKEEEEDEDEDESNISSDLEGLLDSETGWEPSLFLIESEELSDYLCAICRNVFRNPTLSGCPNSHTFCRHCITKWLESSVQSSGVRAGYNSNGQWFMLPVRKICPVCREPTDPSRVVPSRFYSSLINELIVKCPRPFPSQMNESNCDDRDTSMMMRDDCLIETTMDNNNNNHNNHNDDCVIDDHIQIPPHHCRWHGRLSELEMHLKSEECPSLKTCELPSAIIDDDSGIIAKKFEISEKEEDCYHRGDGSSKLLKCQRCCDLENELEQLRKEFESYKQRTELMITELKSRDP